MLLAALVFGLFTAIASRIAGYGLGGPGYPLDRSISPTSVTEREDEWSGPATGQPEMKPGPAAWESLLK